MPRDAENLRRIIREAGFGALEDRLMKYARPSIRVYTSPIANEDTFPLGQSKIGGRPDLPSGVNWPKVNFRRDIIAPLSFLAQFNLSEVKPFDAENLLPEHGWLYFFGGLAEHGQVIYFDGGSAALARQTFPDNFTPDLNVRHRARHYAPCKVEFVSEVNLPFYDANWVELREDE